MFTCLCPQVILLLAIGLFTLAASLQDANRAIFGERGQLLLGFTIPDIEASAEIANAGAGLDHFHSRGQADLCLSAPTVNDFDFAPYRHGKIPEGIAIKL